MARFDALDARFNAMDARFDRLEERLTNVEARLDRVEARLDGLETRLTMLEERVDRRLLETRPIWEAVQAQLKQLNKKFDIVISDIYEMRAEIRSLDERVTNIENRRSQ
ncbi:MAG TPA: hypothetical protein VGC91_18725 [Pyrinomonadaceae bacterium]